MKLRRQGTVRVASSLAALLLLTVGSLGLFRASGAQITNRGVALSNHRAGDTATYRFFFTGNTTSTVGSIRFQLCVEDPFADMPCTAPSGVSFLSANLNAQSGMTGFSIHPSTTANELILTRTPAPGSAAPSNYTMSPVTNPSVSGAMYGRIQTYASTDASGAAIDNGGIATYIDMSSLSIQTYVPPYLLFCVGNTIIGNDCDTAQGNYIDFGELQPNRTASGQTQIVAATNAKYGFTVAVQGSTMASGTNVIPALASPDVSRQGVGQFGLNLRANTTPNMGQDPQGLGLSAVVATNYNQPNFYSFQSGDFLVNASDPDMEKYTVSYVVNVAKGQAPGFYVSTLTYIALASF